MPLMKGFPSKHRVKEEKGAIKNSGVCLSIKKYVEKIGHLILFGMGVILLSQSSYKQFLWEVQGFSCELEEKHSFVYALSVYKSKTILQGMH